MNFSERLKIIRAESKLTQAQVAQILEIAESAYRRYEIGKSLPGFEKLVKLSECFGVTLDYLMLGK